MIFFSILIVFILLQIFGTANPVQRDEWLSEWSRFITEKISHITFRLSALVVVPVLIVALLDTFFHEVLFGALSLGLYVLVLLYSLGRGEFNEAINNYLMSWRGGNFEAAYQYAGQIGDFPQSETIGDKQQLHDNTREAILYEGYQRWFAVVFWFLLLGPAGALAYRVSYLTAHSKLCSQSADSITDREEPIQQLALKVIHYFDWVPARLLAGSFSMMGRFESAVEIWSEQLSDNKPVAELIDHCAVAALHNEGRITLSSDQGHAIEQGEREISAVQGLLSRSVIFWLVIIALLQLIV